MVTTHKIAILCRDSDEFIVWRLNNIPNKEVEIISRREFKYNNLLYICVSEYYDLSNNAFNNIIELECANELDCYLQLSKEIKNRLI